MRMSQVLLLLPMLLYVPRDHKDCWGQGAQDGHLDFHTAPELGQGFRLVSEHVLNVHRDYKAYQGRGDEGGWRYGGGGRG